MNKDAKALKILRTKERLVLIKQMKDLKALSSTHSHQTPKKNKPKTLRSDNSFSSPVLKTRDLSEHKKTPNSILKKGSTK